MHPTSINKTNDLVSGDNKGLAAYFLEKARNPPGTRPGSGAFVGAFAANGGLGDASPNIDGALCRGGPHEGQACDVVHISTCPDDHNKPTDTLCIAFGPGVREACGLCTTWPGSAGATVERRWRYERVP